MVPNKSLNTLVCGKPHRGNKLEHFIRLKTKHFINKPHQLLPQMGAVI
jgi:hypothetical protein